MGLWSMAIILRDTSEKGRRFMFAR